MSRCFDIIGAPFNQLGYVTTKQNTVDGLRCLNQQTWIGLSEWISVRNTRWNCDIQDLGDVAVSAEVLSLIAAGKKEAALSAYSAELKAKLLASYSVGRTPITIGGDHSIAVGTLQATMEYYQKQQGKKVAVIWVDAHADCNNSLASNLHGKPLAMLMDKYPHNGWSINPDIAIKPEDVFYVAIRDLMPNEHQLINDHGITNYDMASIDRLGINTVLKELSSHIESHYDHLYLSFDYDALEGSTFRACATPNVGGLSAREAIHLVHTLASSSKFIGADFVEYLPELDHDGVSKELMIKLIDACWGFRT
ncbi:arginase [Agarivorans sp. OAG1]|uniref:arginase family protein n=1 Tax=Agarivorans sp. OAG1 TaxID=3082387 RepID=UPI002B2E1F5F|nr:arginase [Agarivorans sp. OAG1]